MNLVRLQRLLFVLNVLFLIGFGATFAVDPYMTLHGNRSESGSSDEGWNPGKMPLRKEFSEYARLMTGKDLFKVGLKADVGPTQKDVIADYRYVGYYESPGGPAKALLQDITTKECRTVLIGDTVGDYEITGITRQSITLSKDEKDFELKR